MPSGRTGQGKSEKCDKGNCRFNCKFEYSAIVFIQMFVVHNIGESVTLLIIFI